MKTRILATAVLFAVCSSYCLAADDLAVGTRHVRHYVRPTVTELARKLNLKGAVKLGVDIGPNGKVIAVRPIGGHPLLVDSAIRAVREWQFDPTTQMTTGVVTIVFE
jgi:TonB family protein